MNVSVRSTRQTTARSRHGWRAWAPLPAALGVAALTAACGPAYGGMSTAGTSAAVPAPQRTSAALGTESVSLGTILTDGAHRTVYEFAKDTGSTSTCNGGCAAIWPPVAAPPTVPSSLPGVTGRLGSTTRTDGSTQLTIAGHPVYTYSGDSAAGQTNGQGLRLNGGVWSVVAPSGSPVTGSSAMAPSATY